MIASSIEANQCKEEKHPSDEVSIYPCSQGQKNFEKVEIGNVECTKNNSGAQSQRFLLNTNEHSEDQEGKEIKLASTKYARAGIIVKRQQDYSKKYESPLTLHQEEIDKQTKPLAKEDEEWINKMISFLFHQGHRDNSLRAFTRPRTSESVNIDAIKRLLISVNEHPKNPNDENLMDTSINYYFHLLQDRDNALSQKKNTFLTSHYIPWFITYGYSGIEPWLRKKNIDLLASENVFFPYNIANWHWACLVGRIKENRIEYYDSIPTNVNQRGNEACDHLYKLLKATFDARQQVETGLSFSENWAYDVMEVPRQEWNDCGVFTCMFANASSLNLPIAFESKDMILFRKKIAVSLARNKIM